MLAKLIQAWAFIKTVRWYWFAVLAIFLVGFSCGGCVCKQWRDVVGEENHFGWIAAPDEVERVVATLPSPTFADAALAIMRDTPDKDALLYQACQKVTGSHLPPHDQNGTGCCVGEGFSAALEYLQCVDIALKNAQQEYKPISAAATYALAREAGDMLRGGDGAVGAYAAKAVTTMGVVSGEDAKDDNTTGREHGALAKKWGRSGLPSDLKSKAREKLVGTASRVRGAEDIRVALSNGYPVAVCCNVGFEPFRRDAEGFCKAGGSWAHCMAAIAYRADRRAFCILQSWGNQPPGPTSLGQPPASFWITWETMERMGKSGDSYALSSFKGFPKQQIDWFALRPRPARKNVAARLMATFALAY